MPKTFTLRVARDDRIVPREIEDLRAAVGWDRCEGTYDQVLDNSYAHFTVRENKRLLAFLNVISDGVGDAFLVDLMVHPSVQRRGLGKAVVETAVAELTEDGVKCIQVTFTPDLEDFYRDRGFHIFKAGIIDNDPGR